MHEKETKDLLKLLLVVVAAILLMINMGCSIAKVKTDQMELWNVDPKDHTIYRKKNDGYEEFFFCSDKRASTLICMERSQIESLIKHRMCIDESKNGN